MSRNEIRLRRQRLTASGTDRFRNYSEVLNRHERDRRIRMIIRIFLTFMTILVLVGIIFVLSRVEKWDIPWEKNKDATPAKSASAKAEVEPPISPTRVK